MVTLDDVAAPVQNAIVDGPFGSNLKLNDYVPEGVPVLQGKNITDDTFRWFDVRFISSGKAEELKRSSVRIGDILIVKIGSIGYSAILDDLNGFDHAIIPANLAKVTPNLSKVDIRYLHRWLMSTAAKNYLVRAASKTAQPALSLGKIKGLPVPLPPLPEQRRIAEILDKADALRAQRRAALAHLDTLTQSIFLDMFGDPATNPKGWPKRDFDGTMRDETSRSERLPRSAFLSEGRFPVVDQGQDFIGGYCDYQRYVCQSALPVIVFGDHTRVVKLVREPFVVGADGAKVLVAQSGVEADFLAWLLQTLTIPNLGYSRHMREVKRITFPIPPIQLQHEFSRRIALIDRQRASFQRSRIEIDALFASLQQRAFRGEL